MAGEAIARDLPKHVGLIMDGNGRWAKARGLPRSEGHREGLKTAKKIVKAAEDLGITVLSLYVFSTENWKRAADEVGLLMSLIKQHLSAELDFYQTNGLRVLHSGDASGLPKDIAREIKKVEAATASFGKMTVNLAINYGGRDEIVRAARRLAETGTIPSEEALRDAMDHPELPYPDLIIRTSAEMRLSNFLTWESAYSELYFCDKLWPDFGPEDLAAAVEAYATRERRFGGIPMSNVVQRLLLFFLGIPLVAAIVILFPQFNHGAAVLLILVFVVGCCIELSFFFKDRGIAANPAFLVLMSLAAPIGAYLGGFVSGGEGPSSAITGMSLAAGLALILLFARFAFVRAEEIPEVLSRATALAFSAVYPGLLGSFIVLIASEPRYATESLLVFCILAFSNDSLAWLIGITIGRRRGIVAVSPNKSVAGFVGGMCGSIGTAFGCAALLPKALSAPWWAILAFGAAVGAAVIVGDLFESALKRSAGIKDSGSIVPGRGGFLDSFDSLLFAAPVYYGLSLLFGYFR